MSAKVTYYAWTWGEVPPPKRPRISRWITGDLWNEYQRWDPRARKWVWDEALIDAVHGLSSTDAWVDWITEDEAVVLCPGLDTQICWLREDS